VNPKQTETDWTIRQHEGRWVIFRDGRPDAGGDAPASLLGIHAALATRPGPVPDLPDVGVAQVKFQTDQNRCVVTSRTIRNNGTIGVSLKPRGDFDAVVFAPGGRRWLLSQEGTTYVAPHLGEALASFYGEPAPRYGDPAEWRKKVADYLLTQAFAKEGDVAAGRSGWLVRSAVTLLTTQPAESKPVATQTPPGSGRASSRSRQAVRA
jgi:hypothetical protein